jgi:hypothetical protein
VGLSLRGTGSELHPHPILSTHIEYYLSDFPYEKPDRHHLHDLTGSFSNKIAHGGKDASSSNLGIMDSPYGKSPRDGSLQIRSGMPEQPCDPEGSENFGYLTDEVCCICEKGIILSSSKINQKIKN